MGVKRLFLYFYLSALLLFPLPASRVACLNSSLADLWTLAGGTVDITVAEAVERGFASADALLCGSASGRDINLEVLVASRADLVIGSADTASHVRLASFLDSNGIDVLLFRQDCFDDFLSAFRILTSMTEREDLFEKYGSGQERGIEEVIMQAERHSIKPRVLFIRAGSAFASVRAKRASDHFAAGIIEDLGAVNVADEYSALTDMLSLEAVMKGDIDMIFIVIQGDEEAGRAYMEKLFSRPGWRDIPAVRQGKVHYLERELFHYKPNGRWLEAYEVMEALLYEKT